MGKHGPQAPDFTIDAMNMAHNQPPSGAGTPWLDNPSQGVITASGAYYASRAAAGVPLEHHCAQPYVNSLLNEALEVL